MSENAPWFRLRGDKWKADTRGLNPQEKAVYIDLLVEMHEREEPLSDEWLDQIRSITRTRPSTFWPAIERLVSLDLFVRVDGGLWSHFMEREIEDRRGRSDKARRNSAKSRQKSAQSLKNRPEKSQQNQWSGDAIEIQIEIDRDAPNGASLDQDKSENKDYKGSPLANAGRSPSGGKEVSIEDINAEFASAIALASSDFEPDLFLPETVIEPPELSDADDLAGFVECDEADGEEGDQVDEYQQHVALLDEILTRQDEFGEGDHADQLRRLARGLRGEIEKRGKLDEAGRNTLDDLRRRLSERNPNEADNRLWPKGTKQSKKEERSAR